jgi:uncharacterized membrane protein YhaH (DUF805 family)
MRFLTTTTPAGRLEYFAVMIVLYIGNFFAFNVLLSLDVDPVTQDFSYSRDRLAAFAFAIVGVLVVGLINVLRRMKDLHMGGGWIIMHFIPLLNIIFHLMLLFSNGMKRETYAPYGDDPYSPNSWVAKPTARTGSAPAVTFRGQPLLLPGEEGWNQEKGAA